MITRIADGHWPRIFRPSHEDSVRFSARRIGLLLGLAASVCVRSADGAPGWQRSMLVAPGVDSAGVFAWGDGQAMVLWSALAPRGFPFLTELFSARVAAGAPWSPPNAVVERESTYDGLGSNEAGEIVRAWWGADSNLVVWTKPPGLDAWAEQSAPVSIPDVPRVPGYPLHGEPEVAVGPAGDVVIVWDSCWVKKFGSDW